jgi:hypothetical protein
MLPSGGDKEASLGIDVWGRVFRTCQREQRSDWRSSPLPPQFELGADDKRNWQGRSDEKIKLAIMTALHWDLAVPRDRVQVSVDSGQVTLTGRVAREYEKSRAEADALMVSGVAGVTNRIAFDGD